LQRTERKITETAAPAPAGATLRVLLTALLALQAIAAFLPGPLLWGVNHLAHVPVPLRLVGLLLGGAVLWTRAGEVLGRWLQRRVAPLLLGRRALAYGLLPLLGAAGFWLLRARTYFLGDGWLLGELVARGVPFHGFDFLDYFGHAWLFHHLHLTTEAAAFQLFAVLSIVAGVLYLVFAAWSARHLSTDDGERVTLYALLVAAAPLELFMGYVECYSFLTAFLLLFLAALTGHYTRRTPVAGVAAAFGAALAIHLDALFLSPLVLLLILVPPDGRVAPTRRRALEVLLPILACLAVTAVIYLAARYTPGTFDVDFRLGRRGQRLLAPLTGEGSLLSGARIKDFLNLVLLLAPVPLALLVAARPGRRRARTRPARGEAVLLTGALGLLLLMLFVHMALGVARDWDLLAPSAAVFTFAAFLLWRRRTGGHPAAREVGAIAATAFLLAAPWFWVNAGEARSVRRFGDVIADLPRFARAYAHEEIGKYHRKAGRTAEALAEYRICTEIFPGSPRFQVALGGLLYNTGRRDEALPVFERAFAADSTYALALEMLTRLHAERGDTDTALRFARRLARRPDEPARAAAMHGALAATQERYDEAIEAYRGARRKDSTAEDYAMQFGALCLLRERYAEAEDGFRAVLARDAASVMGRTGLVASIWLPISAAPAAWGDPSVQRRMREALRLATTLEAEGAADPATRAVAEQIRGVLQQLTSPPAPG
jgi:tetratricopeptide (TPR) repeat protein